MDSSVPVNATACHGVTPHSAFKVQMQYPLGKCLPASAGDYSLVQFSRYVQTSDLKHQSCLKYFRLTCSMA